jgi:SOS-response transcriptional repressor LexA
VVFNRLKFLERVRARRLEMGIPSERALCLKAGMSPNFLRALRTGKAQSPKSNNLQKLAVALETTTDWLLGGDHESDNPYRAIGAGGQFDYVFVIGEVQAGVWREAFQWPEHDRYPMPFPADPRFPNIPRFALLVRGHSMNKLYPDSSVIACSRYSDIGRGPSHGEKVVAMRFRHSLVEATCKEFVLDSGVPWLVPHSTDESFKPMKLTKKAMEIPDGAQLPAIVNASDFDEIRDEWDDVQVLALVTGCYIPQ